MRLDDRVLPGRDPQLVEVALPQPEAFLEFGRRVVGQEGARRGPSRPRAACPRGRRPRRARSVRPSGRAVDAVIAREFEGLRVHPGAVAVAVRQEDRAVRDDPVEVLAARRPALERGHVPAAAADPCLVGVRPRHTPR